VTKKKPRKPTVAEVTMADPYVTGIPDTPKTRAQAAATVAAALAKLGTKKR
jgi:hypothetical protein